MGANGCGWQGQPSRAKSGWRRAESGSGGANGRQDEAERRRPRNAGGQNGILNEQQGNEDWMVDVLVQNSVILVINDNGTFHFFVI